MSAADYIKAIFLLFKEKLRPVVRKLLHEQNEAQIEERKQFYKTLLIPHALVFDVGANLGNRIDAFLASGAKVVAFEPQAFCHQFLKLKYRDRIKLRNIALGENVSRGFITLNKDSTTIATMSDKWKEEVGKGRFKAYRWGTKQAVEVDTLENQIKTFGRPHFIKIDVEGFEEQVLKGLRTPVPLVSFEYTTPEMTDSALGCIHILNNLSPAYEYNFAAGENTWFENTDWMDYQTMRNVLINRIDALKGFGDIYARLKNETFSR